MKLIFDNPSTLADELEQLEKEIAVVRERIDEQEAIVGDAEALSERLHEELHDLIRDRDNLEAQETETGLDTWDRLVGETEIIGGGLGWNKYCSVVRDPHEKLRFAESDHLVLVLMGDTVWGCDDFVPCKGSELTFLSEGIS